MNHCGVHLLFGDARLGYRTAVYEGVCVGVMSGYVQSCYLFNRTSIGTVPSCCVAPTLDLLSEFLIHS